MQCLLLNLEISHWHLNLSSLAFKKISTNLEECIAAPKIKCASCDSKQEYSHGKGIYNFFLLINKTDSEGEFNSVHKYVASVIEIMQI